MTEERRTRLRRIHESIIDQVEEFKKIKQKLETVENSLQNKREDLDQEALDSLKSESAEVVVAVKRILENAAEESMKLNKEMESLNTDFVTKSIKKVGRKASVPDKVIEMSVDISKWFANLATGGAASLAFKAAKNIYDALRSKGDFENACTQLLAAISDLEQELNDVKARANVVIVRIKEISIDGKRDDDVVDVVKMREKSSHLRHSEAKMSSRDTSIYVEDILSKDELENMRLQLEMLRKDVEFLKAQLEVSSNELSLLKSQLAKNQLKDPMQDEEAVESEENGNFLHRRIAVGVLVLAATLTTLTILKRKFT